MFLELEQKYYKIYVYTDVYIDLKCLY